MRKRNRKDLFELVVMTEAHSYYSHTFISELSYNFELSVFFFLHLFLNRREFFMFSAGRERQCRESQHSYHVFLELPLVECFSEIFISGSITIDMNYEK